MGSPKRALALLLIAIVVLGSVPIAPVVAAQQDAPSGFVGVPDANIDRDLLLTTDPELLEIIESDFPTADELRGSTLTTRGAESLEVTITSWGRATGTDPTSLDKLAIVLADDVDHGGRKVAIPAAPMIDALGYEPHFAYGLHEDGTTWRRPVTRSGKLLIFEVPRFSTNTITWSGLFTIEANPAQDGSSFTYEQESDAGNYTINVTGHTTSEWDNESRSDVGAESSLHSTDAEFNNGTLIGGATVEGSGSSANVSITTAPAGSQSFSYTGAEQTWTVPDGVTEVTVSIWGAEGGAGNGDGSDPSTGGQGGYVNGTLAVTPGETLYIYVGGKGGAPNGGWNGGANGGDLSGADGGGGGGASDVRQGGSTLSDRAAVAGGGGGGGASAATDDWTGNGGAGGANTGAEGGGNFNNVDGGNGGTQSAGGAGGDETASDKDGGDGSLGAGGAGNQHDNGGYQSASGGGGAGYYGGGGGSAHSTSDNGYGAGGGGGSNYVGGLSSVNTNQRGGNTGNGLIELSWDEKDGNYTSPVHSVGNSNQGFVEIAELKNESVTITWQTSDGSGWSTLAQQTVTTAGNKSASWPTEPNSSIRVHVNATDQSGSSSLVVTDEKVVGDGAGTAVGVGGNLDPIGEGATGNATITVTGLAAADGDYPGDVTATTSDGATVTFTALGSGTATKELDVTASTTKLNWSFAEGKVKYDLNFKERTQTVDPVVEVNGNTTSYTGSIADGTTKALTTDSAWVVQGTNRVNVTVGDGTLGADAPPPSVDLYYAHDGVDDSSVGYIAEQFTERYNVSKTFGQDQSNANLVIPFQGTVVELRDLDKRVNGGSWTAVASGSYTLNGTELTVELGSVTANDTVAVRANGSKVRVNNGSITVLEATTVGSDLDSKIRIDSWGGDSYLSVGTAGSGTELHYVANPSWSSADEHADFTTAGEQKVYLPNAAAGSTFRARTVPVEIDPDNSDVRVSVVDAANLELAVKPGPGGTGATVRFTYTAATSGVTYDLYSVTEGIVRHSATASSPVTLEDDDSDETLRIQEQDDGETGGGDGGGGGGGGPISISNPLNSIPIILIAAVVGVAGVGYVANRFVDDDAVVLALVGAAGVIALIVAGEGLNPGVVLGPIGEGLGQIVPVLGLGAGALVLYYGYVRFIRGREPPTIQVVGRVRRK